MVWKINTVCKECKEAVLSSMDAVEECGLDCVPLRQGTKKKTSPNQACVACDKKEKERDRQRLGGYQAELNKGKVKRTGSRMGK